MRDIGCKLLARIRRARRREDAPRPGRGWRARAQAGGRCRSPSRSAAEVILVVRTLRRAVGHDQRRLAGASGAPGALRVVGRRRRHVAQVDGIERRDVDAELHGRRAEQDRQENVGSPAWRSSSFSSASFVRSSSPQRKRHSRHSRRCLIDLRGVLAAFDPEQARRRPCQRVGERLVEARRNRDWRPGRRHSPSAATRRTAFAASRQPRRRSSSPPG